MYEQYMLKQTIIKKVQIVLPAFPWPCNN